MEIGLLVSVFDPTVIVTVGSRLMVTKAVSSLLEELSSLYV